jgi:hypothetical protein
MYKHFDRVFFIAISLIFMPGIARAEGTDGRCVQPESPEDVAYCEHREPEIRRLRPSFSEQDRQGLEQRGFSNRFLDDALNGNPNPIGGGGVSNEVDPSELGAISPQDRGLLPTIDPTDVIIPTDVK